MYRVCRLLTLLSKCLILDSSGFGILEVSVQKTVANFYRQQFLHFASVEDSLLLSLQSCVERQ